MDSEFYIGIQLLDTSLYALAASLYIDFLNEGTFIIDKIFKEPKLYKEVINSLYKDYWQKAMEVELETLNSNNTWILVPKTNNIRLIKAT